MILTCVVIIILLAYAGLFHFYKKGWNSLEKYNSTGIPTPVPFISIVVAARNEEENLPVLLDAISKQTYPRENFEVIVIDDHSTDRTREVAESNNMVRVLSLSESETSKKKAIEKAVHAAKGELIVATDADCIPPETWLSTLAQFNMSKNAVFIAAPVKYKIRNNVLGIFQGIDFITLQGITAAGVAKDFHSMCNGANLAYSKEAFLNVNGFEGIDKIASGDDLLLMHKISKQYPGSVYYLKSGDAVVETTPPQTWKGFYRQRIRWASKTVHYEDKKIFYVLLLALIVNVIFFVLLAASFFNPYYWLLVLFYLAVKTLIEADFIRPVAKFFGQVNLLKWFFLLQPLHIFYTVSVGILSQFGSYEWKGRKTK